MKKGFWFRSVRVVVVLTVALVAAVLLVWLRPRAERQERPTEGRLVSITEAHSETVSMTVEAFGTVRPVESLRLVAQVAGQVARTAASFVEGGRAAAGTVLLVIDPRPYALEVDRQRVLIDQTLAELAQLDQEVENLNASLALATDDTSLARAEFERLRTLAQRNVVAQTTLDQTKQRHLASLERWQQLKNRLATTVPTRRQIEARQAIARVALAQAELNLEHTRVVAPFDGWVLQKGVERGQHVVPGQQMGTIYRAGALEVEVRIPGQDLRWLPGIGVPGADIPAEVIFAENGEVRTWKARLQRAKASFDAATRTLPVVVAIDSSADAAGPEPPLALRPGMFVTVRLRGDSRDGVFVLPRHALRGDDTVFIADGPRLRIRPVRVLRRYEEKVFVNEGLASGDRVVDSPLSGAVDGMAIRVQE